MDKRGRIVPHHYAGPKQRGSDTHILVPLRIIVWVCSALLTVFAGLIGTGIWLDQRDTTTKTANANKQALHSNSNDIQALEQRMTLNEQTDKTQDAELSRLSAQVESVSTQQSVNSQQLAAIKSLLQQLNDRLKEITSRLDRDSFGRNAPRKKVQRNHDIADVRRVRKWNQ